MTGQVKALAVQHWRPELNFRNPPYKRESIPKISLASTCTQWHVHTTPLHHTHTQ